MVGNPGGSRSTPELAKCTQAGCHRNVLSSGLCGAHYQRKRADRDMARPVSSYTTINAGTCSVDGCERAAVVAGACRLHYGRFRKYGDPHKIGATRTPIRASLPNETSPTKLARLLKISRQRAHQLLNRQAHNARAAVHRALKTGEIVRPEHCERCQQRSLRLEAHHWDYREPLDVRWLCPPCHSVIHPHHSNINGRLPKWRAPGEGHCTIEKAAEILSVSRPTVYSLISKGELKRHAISGSDMPALRIKDVKKLARKRNGTRKRSETEKRR